MMEDNVKAVRITQAILIEMLTTGWESNGLYCVQGIPPDAEFVKAEIEPKTGDAQYIFRHCSWPPVLWDEMELLEIVFNREAKDNNFARILRFMRDEGRNYVL